MFMKGVLLAIPVLWLASASIAQSQTNRSDPVDFHSRLGAIVDIDMPDGWEGELEYEARMVDNASTYRGSYLTG